MIAKPSTTLTPARRFVVRLVLATGATVSTLLGAQTLAFLEQPMTTPEQATNATPSANSAALVVTPISNSSAAVSNPSTADSVTAPAAPQVVIIRNPGAVTAAQGTSANPGSAVAPALSIQTGSSSTAAVIVPQPVLAPVAQSQSPLPAIQAPEPVIQQPVVQQSSVQQPVVQAAPVQPAPRSRSSR